MVAHAFLLHFVSDYFSIFSMFCQIVVKPIYVQHTNFADTADTADSFDASGFQRVKVLKSKQAFAPY